MKKRIRRCYIIRIRKGKAKLKIEVPKERINEQISATKVRLISADGKQVGIVDLDRALQMADDAELDLVEIAPGADPPVCKIMRFDKYYYNKEKGVREAKKRQHVVQLKEIKMGPNTEEHDFEFKKRNAIKFLKQQNKVKFTIRFKGRQIAHKDLGYHLLERLIEDLKDYAEVDTKPTEEARTISMIMVARKDIANAEEESTA
ncbi:MAG: translation initiation factor IF-3 [Candidatus Cloacimonetes bacterium]|nr:translation initiation factor IF-3 [Candidatus Cloacimonadota bacterium]